MTSTFAETGLGVALALQIHLIFDPSLAVGTNFRLRVFDERLYPLDGNPSFQQTDQPADCESIFHLIVSLVIGLDVQDSSLATHVIILLERLKHRWPGVLNLCTLRLILVSAFIICLKHDVDEEFGSLVGALEFAGFPSIGTERLLLLESAFMYALGWKTTVNRMTYFWYTLELRMVVRQYKQAVFAAYPRLAELVAQLDGVRKQDTPSAAILVLLTSHDR